MMTSQQCVDFARERIAKGMALEEIVSEIFTCRAPRTRRQGGDNMTAIIALEAVRGLRLDLYGIVCERACSG